MDTSPAVPQAGMYVMKGCLIVSIQFELYDDVIRQIRENILEKVHQSRIRGVVLDVSMVDVMDSHIAASFCESAQMLGLLGAQTVLVGMRPAVASALMALERPPLELQTAVTLDQALTMLEPLVRASELKVIDTDDAPEERTHPDEDDRVPGSADATPESPRLHAGAKWYE